MSITELQHHEFIDFMLKVTGVLSISPSVFVLDIHEKIMHPMHAPLHEKLEKLSELGYLLSIDGFGTTQTIIKDLSKTPIDFIKLNSSFIETYQTSKGQDFLFGLLQLSEAMGFSVIQKGIEMASIDTLIMSQHIPLAQGHYYGKPKDLDAYGEV